MAPRRPAVPGFDPQGDLRPTQQLERVAVLIEEDRGIPPEHSIPPQGEPGRRAHGLVNELLALTPTSRKRDLRLLICATNSVRSLDPALLGPGRFDNAIPIGPPDAEARRAILTSLVGRAEREDVDIDQLVRGLRRACRQRRSVIVQSAAPRAFAQGLNASGV